jgi:hypothetical protein
LQFSPELMRLVCIRNVPRQNSSNETDFSALYFPLIILSFPGKYRSSLLK